MNNSYGHNLVTSIHQISRKNKPDLLIKNRWLTTKNKKAAALVRGLDWWPQLRTDQLDFFDPEKRDNALRDQFSCFLDFSQQQYDIKNYVDGTSFQQYFECWRNKLLTEIDNPNNFSITDSRLLCVLCGHEQRIVFSATISHRGFVAPSNKSLMLSNIRMFGKKTVLADHVWVNYTNAWSVAEPLIGGKRVYIIGKVVKYKRKAGTTDYSIKASRVIRA